MSTSDEFEVLRRAVGQPPPAGVRRVRAREQLDAAIDAEVAQDRPPTRRRRGVVAATAVAVVAVAAVAYLAVGSRAPASALQELAEAARQVDPIEVPPGAFAYTRSEHVVLVGGPGDQFPGVEEELVAYLLPTTRESWIRDDGYVQLVTDTHPPAFFDPRVEAAYFEAGLDRLDGVGETVTTVFGEVTDPFPGIAWPTDRDKLEALMEELIPDEAGQPPREVQLLELAAAILRERIVEPTVRATLVEVLATLDLEVKSTDDAVTVTVTYDQGGQLRYSVTFDNEANLITETTILLDASDEPYIPAGTAIRHSAYTPPVIVPDLQPPLP